MSKTPRNTSIEEEINFKTSKNALVSLCIYCDNEQDLIISLKSIHSNIPDVPFEIIVAPVGDNVNLNTNLINNILIATSTDIIATSINAAIEIAKGEYIYVLKGGLTVFPSFVDELLHVFNKFTSVGIVGSLSLYQDGTIEDTGKLFCNEGEIHTISCQDIHSPSHNYISKTDLCIQTSFMFRRITADGILSSFNDRMKELWFEDFCLKIKFDYGQYVYNNPLSKVGDSRSKNRSTIEERFHKPIGIIDNTLFLAKWKETLKTIKARNESERLAELHSNKFIIFFHQWIPMFNDNSGDLRLKELMLAFIRLGYDVSLMCKKNRITNRNNLYYQRHGIRVYYQTTYKGPKSIFLKNIHAKNVIGWYYTADVYAESSSLVDKHFVKTASVFDMIDIHHLRYQRALELSPENKEYKLLYDKYFSLEKHVAQNADLVVTISDKEQQYMQAFSPESEIVTVSNIHYTKVNKTDIPLFHERQDLFFIGSQHHPNIDAVKFLVDEIMPYVWEQLPNVKLHIVGSLKSAFEELGNPRVVFHGRVENVAPFLLNTKMMVAPLRYGAGVKGKVGQALEYFLPVVTSTIGAEGMYLKDYENVLIADDPAEFARKIIELYTDVSIWERLSSFSEKSLLPFSLNTLGQQIEKIESLIH